MDKEWFTPDHKGHTWDLEWYILDREWYIQGSGMVYTGIGNGIYRDQEWYAPEKKVIIVENIDHLLLLIVQLSVCVLVYHI